MSYKEILEWFNADIETVQAWEEVSWVDINGIPMQEGGDCTTEIDQILMKDKPTDMSVLRLRDPAQFVSENCK